MREARQTIVVRITSRKSNKNSLERWAGAYGQAGKIKGPYIKEKWNSSNMKKQKPLFILVVVAKSDFHSFCKCNMKYHIIRYHILSTDNILSYLQPFLTPRFSAKYIHISRACV